MKQAVGYLRVSSKGQIDGHGFDRQRDEIRSYAKLHSYEIVMWYEEAWTGTEEERPEFMRMVEDILSNGARTIIVECMDRFGRESMTSASLIALLIRNDIAMISAMNGEDVTAAVQDDVLLSVVQLAPGHVGGNVKMVAGGL